MQPKHHVIITGTGRAGTTFLVRLLTALGLSTGYDENNWRADYSPHCAAGLERELTDPDSPYIVKNPELCVTLGRVLARGGVVIDHALVPVRDLEAAARSRARVGGQDGAVPGGLVGTDNPKEQRGILADRFHQLVHTLVSHDIPHTFLLFPRFVQDAEYAFAKLRPVLPGIEYARFEREFRAIADGSLVHTFTSEPQKESVIGRTYLEEKKAKRRWRRVRRFTGWSAAAALLALVWNREVPASSNRSAETNFGGARYGSSSMVFLPGMRSYPAGGLPRTFRSPPGSMRSTAGFRPTPGFAFFVGPPRSMSAAGQPGPRTFVSPVLRSEHSFTATVTAPVASLSAAIALQR